MTPAKRKRPAKCPVCAKPALADHAPFCSVRCGQIDLGRWLGGHYAIAPQGPAEYEDGVPRPDNSVDNDNNNNKDGATQADGNDNSGAFGPD